MVTEYGSDSDVTNMLNEFTFEVMPLLNVDGYAYTHTDVSNSCRRRSLFET